MTDHTNRNNQPRLSDDTPDDLRLIEAKLAELARLEQSGGGPSLESRVFAATVERLAASLPTDLKAVAVAVDDLAASAPEGLADRVFSASVASLASTPAVSPVVARLGRSAKSAGTSVAFVSRWWTSRLVRVAAAFLLGAGVITTIYSVRASQAHRVERLAAAKVLATSVDASIAELFSDSGTTSDSEISSYDPYGLEESLTGGKDNAS